MGFKAPEQVGDAGGVLRDLRRKRIDCARSVEELSVCTGYRPNADKRVARAQIAAERLAVDGILEVGSFRRRDELDVRALRNLERRSVALHQRRCVESQQLGPRAEISPELGRV